MNEFSNGTYKILYIKAGSVYYPIGCLTSNSFSENIDILGTTGNNSNGWTSITSANQSYNISFDGLVTLDATITGLVTYEQLKQLKRNRGLIEWKIEDDAGNINFGSGYITDLSDSANIDEFVSFNGSIIGQGIPTYDNTDPYYGAWFGYKQRVETTDGVITSVLCTQSFIKELTL
jgi:hypothetical protein